MLVCVLHDPGELLLQALRGEKVAMAVDHIQDIVHTSAHHSNMLETKDTNTPSANTVLVEFSELQSTVTTIPL